MQVKQDQNYLDGLFVAEGDGTMLIRNIKLTHILTSQKN
jgi:hypothetical protein